MPQPQLNVLWISLEDCSQTLGCYGDPVARTPHLDRLAAEGVRYDLAFSTAPVCAPARAAVITGCYAASIGAHNMRTSHVNPDVPGAVAPYSCVPPPHVKCLGEYFRAAGWFCTNNHKTDYQIEVDHRPPFTAWDVQGGPGPAGTYDTARAHWRQRAPGQPFFSVFNLLPTHESACWLRADGTTNPDSINLPPYLADTAQTRRSIARHYDALAENDAVAGSLLRQLEEDGLADSTIVVVWSDHGNGRPRGKRWLRDSGLRVPFIVRFPPSLRGLPGFPPPGSTSSDLVSTLDLAPSMLSLCGLPPPRHLQGRIFAGPDRSDPPACVFATRDRMDECHDRIRAARDARYLYVRHHFPTLSSGQWIPYSWQGDAVQDLLRAELTRPDGDAPGALFAPRAPEELYDSVADPHQQRNVACDPAHRGALLRLRAAMDEWERRYDRFGDWDEVTLRRFFHPDGDPATTATPRVLAVTGGPPGESLRQGHRFQRNFPGMHPTPDGGTVPTATPVLLFLQCATPGASIGWALDGDPAERWRLYTGPVRIDAGHIGHIRAKAVRYGWRTSDETRVQLGV